MTLSGQDSGCGNYCFEYLFEFMSCSSLQEVFFNCKEIPFPPVFISFTPDDPYTYDYIHDYVHDYITNKR